MNDLRTRYRAFRKAVIKRCDDRMHRTWGEDSKFRRGRNAIDSFREYLTGHSSELTARTSDGETLLRRALRIPADIPLVYAGWSRLFLWLIFFLPTRVALLRARRILNRVGTFEGRRFVFDLAIEPTLPGHHYFEATLDQVLRRLCTCRTAEELAAIRYVKPDWIRAMRLLGLREPAEIVRLHRNGGSQIDAAFVLMLVEEGIVLIAGELTWIDSAGCEFRAYDHDHERIPRHRSMVRALLAHGVSRRWIAGICKFSHYRFEPEALVENLKHIEAAGIDPTSALEAVGQLAWIASLDRWRFLFQCIGARTAADVQHFKDYLASTRDVPSAFVAALKGLGAAIPDLAACQSLMLSAAHRSGENSPLEGLALLAGEPHSLDLWQLAQCITYLGKNGDLKTFLSILTRFGYAGSGSVLAFQVCYPDVRLESLERLLAIAEKLAAGQQHQVIAEWVRQAAKTGYLSEYEYLIETLSVSDFAQLQHLLKLGTFGLPFLRYLTEERGLATLKALRDWYYDKEAIGIEGLRIWGPFDSLDKIVLDDASNRKRYNLIEGNRSCISDWLSKRTIARLGQWPYDASEETKDTYRRNSEELCAVERERLLPLVAMTLDSTNGIVPRSVLDLADRPITELQAQLRRLSDLTDALMTGGGPSVAALTPVEADAVALLYRITSERVSSTWSQIVGREGDIAYLNLRPNYPMVWKGESSRLARTLDREGFFALFLNAAQVADRFAPQAFLDMFTACKHLRPKQLVEQSADVRSLANHLGVLLAAGRGDFNLDKWDSRRFENLARLEEERPTALTHIEELVELFHVELGDALQARQASFIDRFSDEDAALLASKLGDSSESGTGRDRLSHALQVTREKLLPIYQRWAKAERRKFITEESASRVTHLSAVVSKHPAAFFARETMGLCTAGRVDLWCEPRHSHLLVFDMVAKSLVGMAYVYVEQIREIHPSRPSLVIRAINPTIEMLACHSPASIVDAFLEVACQVAKANAMACVAIPCGGSELSNRDKIEQDIRRRFVKPARSYIEPREVAEPRFERISPPLAVTARFACYEKGGSAVNTVYLVGRRFEPANSVLRHSTGYGRMRASLPD